MFFNISLRKVFYVLAVCHLRAAKSTVNHPLNFSLFTVMIKNGYKIKIGDTVTKIVRQKIIKNKSCGTVSRKTYFTIEISVFLYVG